MKIPTAESSSIAAGIIAALGASSCCVLPLLLVALGLGGTWIAQIRELERFFPVFIAFSAAAFGFAFYRLYFTPATCMPGEACANPAVRKRQRAAFWATLFIASALILSPYYAPALLG